MEESSKQFFEWTKHFWQARTGKPISDEDANEMIENIIGFSKTLIEWDQEAKDQISSSINRIVGLITHKEVALASFSDTRADTT